MIKKDVVQTEHSHSSSSYENTATSSFDKHHNKIDIILPNVTDNHSNTNGINPIHVTNDSNSNNDAIAINNNTTTNTTSIESNNNISNHNSNINNNIQNEVQ